MSFTIKCDVCGNEQTFKQGDKIRGDHVDMTVYMTGGYMPYPEEINICCENPKCNNIIDLKV